MSTHITITADPAPRQDEVFTESLLAFLGQLHDEFGARVAELRAHGDASTKAQGEAERFAASWSAVVEKHLTEPPCTYIAPRGLARLETRIQADGAPTSAGIVDFGLHLHRNARRLLDEGRAPFISLLGMESESELRMWQDLFHRAEQLLDLPDGTVRAICFSAASIQDEEDAHQDSQAVLTG
ncbi:hypothetical protein [Nesterenkonia sp. NBAIMH1]|uniref:hypothetical protein n=1 Tax=Nesterenkonia sp. NBAIMH1 TaxID=2600320 RepID=UPI0011B70454|nr:hypothetical protein [Nesterenkonia sp. NBAIMH1]